MLLESPSLALYPMKRILTFLSNAIHGTAGKIDDTCYLRAEGLHAYKYVEGDRALIVEVEMLMVHPDRVIYRNSIKKWLPPHENTPISEDERERILQKICKYFDDRRMAYIVE